MIVRVHLTGERSPVYNPVTHVVTVPAVPGIEWKVNGSPAKSGNWTPLDPGGIAVVTAEALTGYETVGPDDWAFRY